MPAPGWLFGSVTEAEAMNTFLFISIEKGNLHWACSEIQSCSCDTVQDRLLHAGFF